MKNFDQVRVLTIVELVTNGGACRCGRLTFIVRYSEPSSSIRLLCHADRPIDFPVFTFKQTIPLLVSIASFVATRAPHGPKRPIDRNTHCRGGKLTKSCKLFVLPPSRLPSMIRSWLHLEVVAHHRDNALGPPLAQAHAHDALMRPARRQ